MMNKLCATLLLSLISSLTCAQSTESTTLHNDPAVQNFINEVAEKHQLETKALSQWFEQASLQPQVLAAIKKPYEGLPWHKYRRIFLKPERATAGAKFWQTHAETLKRAEATYGVPAAIIVAILGVETYYGKYTGKHPIFDSLATLAFHYPPRASFFKKELEQFLLLAKEEQLDPMTLQGSYAGAMGQPQFIASSYRAYAVDFNGDGQRNLIDSIEDSIGSVANYFKAHGWQAGQPIVLNADPKTEALDSWLAPLNNPKPKTHFTAFQKAGIPKPDSLAAEDKAALFSLETETGPAYYFGLQNFYVITRYNHSALYAMAVYELSQAIEKEYHQLRHAN